VLSVLLSRISECSQVVLGGIHASPRNNWGEDVECSDPVLACGGEVGADGGEGSRAVVTLEVVEWARPGCSRWCERSSEVKLILI